MHTEGVRELAGEHLPLDAQEARVLASKLQLVPRRGTETQA